MQTIIKELENLLELQRQTQLQLNQLHNENMKLKEKLQEIQNENLELKEELKKIYKITDEDFQNIKQSEYMQNLRNAFKVQLQGLKESLEQTFKIQLQNLEKEYQAQLKKLENELEDLKRNI